MAEVEPEQEYILYFYDGRVRRVFGKRSQLQKLPVSRIEEAPVGFDPFSNIRRDMERIRKAVGTIFTTSLSPEELLKRIRDRMDRRR